MDNENSNDQGGNPSSAEADVMPTHTPGPWHYQEDSDAYTHIVRGPTGKIIASTAQNSSGEAEANARLIAAAPEMEKCLKDARNAIASLDKGALGWAHTEYGEPMYSFRDELMHNIDGALKKARGE